MLAGLRPLRGRAGPLARAGPATLPPGARPHWAQQARKLVPRPVLHAALPDLGRGARLRATAPFAQPRRGRRKRPRRLRVGAHIGPVAARRRHRGGPGRCCEGQGGGLRQHVPQCRSGGERRREQRQLQADQPGGLPRRGGAGRPEAHRRHAQGCPLCRVHPRARFEPGALGLLVARGLHGPRRAPRRRARSRRGGARRGAGGAERQRRGVDLGGLGRRLRREHARQALRQQGIRPQRAPP
mmetsp:Transcript_50793/g.147986  ORF Transcript_50793/g.147986 Transcript_50793/m.147986 type:complete len:241 (+) Transcript_50793:945-1667(+)